jgi:cytochrome c oxidase subunit 2
MIGRRSPVESGAAGAGRVRSACWLLAIVALAGCRSVQPPMTTMAPKSDLAAWIHTLYLQVIVWDSLILILVGALLALGLFRYSTRAGAERTTPPESHERLDLEVAWTVGPALVLLAIAIPTVRVTFRSETKVPPANALRVDVTARQWWWEARYPRLGLVTANEIHLPAGRPVRLRLRSADVIHSFWVPKLGGKRDIIPGHANNIVLVPRVPGVYLGQCAEFCGLSHANMRFRVVVDSPEDFAKWKDHELSPATSVETVAADDPVRAGERIFASSPCVTCHTVSGVSAGHLAPDLSHFASRTTLAGGTLANTPENLSAWLRHPTALKPGAQMPDLGLPPEQVGELVAYLETLH